MSRTAATDRSPTVDPEPPSTSGVSPGSGGSPAITPSTSEDRLALRRRPGVARGVAGSHRPRPGASPRPNARSLPSSPRSRNAGMRRPRRARPLRKLADPEDRCRRHRPAGRRVRRPAVHPAQGHHGDSAGAPDGRRARHAGRSPMFWVDAEDHDWGKCASCTVLDASFQPRDDHPCAAGGRGRTCRSRR